MGKHPAGVAAHDGIDLSHMFEGDEGLAGGMPDLSAMFAGTGLPVAAGGPPPPGLGKSPPAAGERSVTTGKKSPAGPGKSSRNYFAHNKYNWKVTGLSQTEVGRIIR
eukprot:TRINITY_DN40780_c0_g1_i1.p2 TRINITY_DN40780_c0_g1~~TRINITY_DN40780_c0_g1_i1.p2  ORF type:complete len:107 (+),score=25.53 TRINITY_DN40780_c0_g1_i1:76-396(+)